MVLPRLRIECLPGVQTSETSPTAQRESLTASVSPEPVLEEVLGEGAINAHRKPSAPSPAETAARVQAPLREEAMFGWLTLIALLYGAGAAVFGIRFVVSLLEVRGLKRSSIPIADPLWRRAMERWCRRLEIGYRVDLSRNEQINVPVAAGWLRASILLPEALLHSSSRKHRHSVLVHELAHVRRGDYPWQILLRLLEVIYWAHPLIWLVGRSVVQVREEACDDLCVYYRVLLS